MNKKDIYDTMNVLIYNDKDIKYYHSVPTMIGFEPETISYESILDGPHSMVVAHNISIQTPSIEEYNNVELDDTLMKRIAKFNKEQECLRLDEEIKKKKQQIKEIEEVLNDRTKRLSKLKDFICDIYSIDIEEEDEYNYYD